MSLKLTALDIQTTGGAQKLNCANTEGIFRIIQSIPSPKAEPFKRWLAKVGYELYIKQKDIALTGLKNECVELQSAKN